MATDSERSAVGQALALLAACLLLVIAISPLQLAFPRTGLALTQLGAILLPALLFLRRKHPDLRSALRWRPISFDQGALALGIGLTGWGVAVLLLELVALALGPAPAAEGLQPTSAADWLIVVVVAAVLPALCEETLFRGCLQGVLERRGPVPGVLLTGVLFGAFHLAPHTMLPAAFLGIVLGTLVVRTGSILAGVLAHFGNNFMAVTVGYVLTEPSEAVTTSLLIGLAAGFGLLGLVFWRRTGGAAPEPSPLAEVPVGVTLSMGWWLRAAAFVAGTVVLLVTTAVVQQLSERPGLRTLTWVDRTGREEPLPLEPAVYRIARVSPDGRRIALDRGRPGSREVWIFEVESGTLRPLARGDGDHESPIWHPDGGRVVYTSGRGEEANLHARAAEGDEAAERLSESASRQWAQSWSSDGRVLVFSSRTVDPTDGPQPLDVGLMMLDEERAVAPLLVSAFNESNPTVSPDGAWIAYRSDESGRHEVYVERFPDLGDRVQVSTDGGTSPLWSADGAELYYRAGRAVIAVPVETGATFTAGRPETLFDGPYLDGLARNYDLAPDGRFLMIKSAD